MNVPDWFLNHQTPIAITTWLTAICILCLLTGLGTENRKWWVYALISIPFILLLAAASWLIRVTLTDLYNQPGGY